jgi:hypothetical protein
LQKARYFFLADLSSLASDFSVAAKLQKRSWFMWHGKRPHHMAASALTTCEQLNLAQVVEVMCWCARKGLYGAELQYLAEVFFIYLSWTVELVLQIFLNILCRRGRDYIFVVRFNESKCEIPEDHTISFQIRLVFMNES